MEAQFILGLFPPWTPGPWRMYVITYIKVLFSKDDTGRGTVRVVVFVIIPGKRTMPKSALKFQQEQGHLLFNGGCPCSSNFGWAGLETAVSLQQTKERYHDACCHGWQLVKVPWPGVSAICILLKIIKSKRQRAMEARTLLHHHNFERVR